MLLFDNTDIGRLKSVIDCRQQGYLGATNVVNYIGNHDHDRMLVELGMIHSLSERRSLRCLSVRAEDRLEMVVLGKERGIFGEEAFRRVRLGAVLQITSVGIPMIWMGEEIGEYVLLICLFD